MNKTSITNQVPLLIDTMKYLLDNGEELLVLKHMYDLSNQEIQQILDLYENE